MPHGVLAKLVAELLDEQSQLPGRLGLLLQELVAEAGNVLLDLLQLACAHKAHEREGIGISRGERFTLSVLLNSDQRTAPLLRQFI